MNDMFVYNTNSAFRKRTEKPKKLFSRYWYNPLTNHQRVQAQIRGSGGAYPP